MSKAEEIQYKAVIAADNQEPSKDYCISAHADHFNGFVEGYEEGYYQAEKDLELTWEDVSKIRQIMFDYNRQLRPKIVENKASLPKDEEYCREVLNRFKKGKG